MRRSSWGYCARCLSPAWRHELAAWTGPGRGRHERVFLDAFYQPVRDDCGMVADVLFFGADVTAQVLDRQKDRELAAVRDRYQTLFDALPFGVMRYSADDLASHEAVLAPLAVPMPSP